MVSQDWMEKDFYKVLGVDKGASKSDIKKAYRALARDLHPDHNPGNEEAAEKFKSVSEAYTVLTDDEKRAEYDSMRDMLGAGAFRRAAGGGGMPFNVDDLFTRTEGGFSDLFGDIFGGARRQRRAPQRGNDIETAVTLDFADTVKGTTTKLSLRSAGACDTCHGSGARPGTSSQTCGRCAGNGLITRNQGGFSFAEPCPDCNGVGTVVIDKCPECQGTGGVTKARTITVRIPAGVREGQKIRLAGRGEPGQTGAPAGDLYVRIRSRAHELFVREGDNLILDLPVSFVEATLGAQVRVPTLDDPVTVRISPGTPNGRTLRIKGRGVPGKGDLLVRVQVQVPTELGDEATEALEKYAQLAPEADRSKLDSYLPSTGK
ncbi:molecular chaperone DnaJ [Natronoglycomyces albus]|uniref:Chaperone protein DnaJ n=1 Tax=Natronoglycomyces albus TaxID=2811108 RepID=A0A895XPT8_9ACTN|nr:molecular chaperone DnaJ [Natronoglycomyces albus]QSB05553.1 molecular chaperone DnaJ [Natronoglycomyces albus]